jgi:glycosyltransferase involved in cell wall biosynthesis
MKVSYISGICVEHDAISDAVYNEMEALRAAGIEDLRLYSYQCTRALPFVRVGNPAEILIDPHFQASDLVVFHFGIHYPLLNLLPLVPRSAKKLVVFHNITPKEFVTPDLQKVIDKSFAQMSNLVWADYIACDSMTNLRILRDAGIHTLAGILPLTVRMSAPAPKKKPSFDDERTRIVFLGRFVRSKGPHELLQALITVLEGDAVSSFDVDLIGNLNLSDQSIVEQVLAIGEKLENLYPGRFRMRLHGNSTNTQKEELLRAADLFVLPTRHEGFCLPIPEAFACGCRVIVYENSNTPFISGGLARLVPTGDVNALADAIREETNMIHRNGWRFGTKLEGYAHFVRQTAEYVAQYSPQLTASRFVRLVRTWLREGNPRPEFLVNTGPATLRMPVRNVSVVSPSYLMERPQWIEMLSSWVWLGESEPCLGEGWQAPENWPPHLRCFGKHARVYLKNPNSWNARLRIRLFHSSEAPGSEPVQLTVSLWGHPIGTQSLKAGIWSDLYFPVPELHQYPFLNLELSVNKTWMPDRVHHNGDIREIGLAVHFVGLEIN